MKKNSNNRIIIIVLSVLLAAVSAGLIIVLVSMSVNTDTVGNVVVPDNIITEELTFAESSKGTDTNMYEVALLSSEAYDTLKNSNLTATEITELSSLNATVAKAASKNTVSDAGTVSLYKFHPSDNVPFAAVNMFPGDSVTNNYNVSVSYKGKVTVGFRITIQPGSEKLAEVLKCRIKNPQTGTILYDGLMTGVSDLYVNLASEKDAVTVIPYEISAYLDTSVGNDYMYKSLKADFVWWVPDEGNLNPKTGDTANIVIWIVIAAAAAVVVTILVVLACRKRRKDSDSGRIE